MEKKFTVEIEITPDNTPQKWAFSADISGIEQLALWTILKNLAEKQINNMLGNK